MLKTAVVAMEHTLEFHYIYGVIVLLTCGRWGYSTPSTWKISKLPRTPRLILHEDGPRGSKTRGRPQIHAYSGGQGADNNTAVVLLFLFFVSFRGPPKHILVLLVAMYLYMDVDFYTRRS